MCERYNAIGSFKKQAEYKESIRARDNYTCQLCGATIDEVYQLDIDHIIPWHTSHDSSPANLRVLCHRCNLKDRRYTLPKNKRRRIPFGEYEDYIKQELANCAPQEE